MTLFYATCTLKSVNNAWWKTDYNVDIVGMINSWRVVNRAFIVASSLLRLAEFRKGGNRLLYLRFFLAAVVKATISRGDFSTFDMDT